MNCLNCPTVQREIGDKEDDIHDLMIQVQETNDLFTHILTEYGYRGDLLKLTDKQTKEQDNSMKPNPK